MTQYNIQVDLPLQFTAAIFTPVYRLLSNKHYDRITIVSYVKYTDLNTGQTKIADYHIPLGSLHIIILQYTNTHTSGNLMTPPTIDVTLTPNKT
jgi:hypothetical protein